MHRPVSIHATAHEASAAAAGRLTEWLTAPDTRRIMPAAGNTPLDLYRQIAERRLNLAHLTIFALDEYAGVPADDPRNCLALIRRAVVEAWGIPSAQFYQLSPVESDALASVQAHERRIAAAGGLDVVILGLGQNGHLALNEPGSAEDGAGGVVALETSTTEAARKWYGGDHAPTRGVTVGLRTILGARRVLIMACGAHKAAAVKAMLEGPRAASCPASFLQTHAGVEVFLDAAAAAGLTPAA